MVWLNQIASERTLGVVDFSLHNKIQVLIMQDLHAEGWRDAINKKKGLDVHHLRKDLPMDARDGHALRGFGAAAFG